MRNLFRYIQYLSFDVVAGAIISSLFIAQLIGVSLTNAILIGLGIAIWLIYTADHLIDAKKIKGDAINPRHSFHQKHFKTISTFGMIAFLIGVWNISFLPMETIKFGGILIFCVGVYFVTIRLADRKSLWHKEMSAALIYSFGIFAGPLSLLGDIPYSTIFLFVQFSIIVILNLLIFPIYEVESDAKDNMKSLAITVGVKRLKGAIKLLFVLVFILTAIGMLELQMLSDGSNWILGQLIFLLMTGVLLSLMIWPSLFKMHNLYRLLGDGVFYFPLIMLL
jgi:4-hydroxybenzoate polyprenyltransferase